MEVMTMGADWTALSPTRDRWRQDTAGRCSSTETGAGVLRGAMFTDISNMLGASDLLLTERRGS